MDQTREYIELWLTETRDRQLYETTDLHERLNVLMEMLTDPDAQTILIAWRESLDLSEYHSASRVSDNLLDMWGCVSRAEQKVETEV